MRALLIVNPNATSTTPRGRDLLAHALSSRVRLDVAHTTHRGHAGELAAQARTDGGRVDHRPRRRRHGERGGQRSARRAAPQIHAVTFRSGRYRWSRWSRVDRRTSSPLAGHRARPGRRHESADRPPGRARRRTIGLGHCDNRWFTFNAGMGLDAQVCEAVDKGRNNGQAVTPGRYVRHAVRAFFRAKREEPTLTVEVPDRDPIDGIHYAFVSNSTPWTYLNRREVHTNPGNRLRHRPRPVRDAHDARLCQPSRSSSTTFGRIIAKSHSLIRFDDVPQIRIRSSSHIGCKWTATISACEPM